MPGFINKQTGERVEFVGEAADWARQSGQYEPESGSYTATLGGTPVNLPAGALEFQTGAAGGAPDASQQVANEQAGFLEEMHGGAGNQALALGEGVLSGVSLGGSDVLLDAFGTETQQRAAQNPGTRLVGEIGGIIAATVATGGTAGGAGASRLGAMLAKTPAGALSKATTQLGRNIGGLKGLAAAQSIEGAGYALGQTGSQLLITDEPLSAEAVWAELGKNAAFGAGAGLVGAGVVHGAGKLGKGWSKLKQAHATTPVVNLASDEGRVIANGMADAVTEIDDAANSLLRVADEVAPPVAAVDEVVPPPVADDIAAPAPEAPPAPPSLADQFAEHQALGQQAMDMAVLRGDPKLKAAINKVRGQFRHTRDAVGKGSPTAEAKLAKYRAAVDDLNRRMGLVDEAAEAAPAAAEQSVAQRMDEAFGRLDDGSNYVFIGDLRKAMPDVPKDVFDAELNALRKSKHFTVDPLQNQTKTSAQRYGADWEEQMLLEGQQRLGLIARRGEPLKPAKTGPADDAAEDLDWLSPEERATWQQIQAEKAAAPKTPLDPDLDEFGQPMERMRPKAPPPGFTLPDKLTSVETKAIKWYGDAAGGHYADLRNAEELNELLRAGNTSKAVKTATRDLDSVLARSATTQPTTVYRGLISDPADLVPGKVSNQLGYLSTSAERSVAEQFISQMERRTGQKVLMSIDVPAGTPAVHIPSTVEDLSKRGFDEAEVLLGRNTRLRILSADVDDAGVVQVRAAVEAEGAPAAAQPVAAPVQPAPVAAVVNPLHAELRAAQKAAYTALDIADGKLTGARIKALVQEPPATLAPKLAALDEYLKTAKAVATDAGDTAALARIDAASKAMSEAASAATGGAGSKLGEVVTSLGLYEAGDTVGGPVGDLAKVAAGYRLAKGAGGKGARGFVGKVVRGMGRNMAGRAASKILPGAGGAGSMAAYGVGANAFSGVFNTLAGQRAIAGLTGNTVTRIGAAFGTLAKPTNSALHAGQNSASLIRDARFGYGETADKPTRKTTREAFKDRSEELAAAAANPMAAQQAIYDQLAEVRKVAPYVADELEMLAAGVTAFLYEKLPRDPGTMMRMGQSSWRPSDHDIRVWGEYVKGALAPVDTFEEAMAGKITPQAADAVRTLFPRLYGEMQRELAERAPELAKKLSLQERTRLSILFDTPLDSTMRPDFRGFMAEQRLIQQERDAAAQQSAKPSAATANPAPLTGAQMLIR
jgi:hypothetical protein